MRRREGECDVVLWDRYLDSVFACRLAEVEEGRSDLTVREIESVAMFTPRPDGVVFLDAVPTVAFRRTEVRHAAAGTPVVNSLEPWSARGRYFSSDSVLSACRCFAWKKVLPI